ncbi:MAG: hypothetical protein O3B13_25200 [Planctomycetota bacterium]|nr:hypothetical protein [Planctomycetota bacterium]
MKKFALGIAVLVASVVGLFALAGRSTQEMAGFVRASADVTVDGATESLPPEVHDRKLDHELKQVRQEMIDRQVQMNLSQRQVAALETEVAGLEASTQRRERLLAEAYPVLKSATDGGIKLVSFASSEYPLAEFQKQIDDLLSMQDRETRQLDIKRTGLDRLRKSIDEGERALAEMRRELDNTEQEVAILRSRREQAETESQTLDLVTAATNDTESVAGLMSGSVERLRGNVDQLEARNSARRDVAPVRLREGSSSVSRGFNRLESLKAIHDAVAPEAAPEPVAEPTASNNEATPVPSDASISARKLEASKVVISIEGAGEDE